MNKHLEPVFTLLLSRLEEVGINYWVYGGISVAAYAGKFVRSNDDVDIFVKEDEFSNARLTLKTCCTGNFRPIDHDPLKRGEYERPKFDIKIGKVEGLSMVPAYLVNSYVKLVFGSGIEEYSNRILDTVERNIEGYRFFTPRDECIKQLFMNYLRAAKSKVEIEDARAMLSHNN